MVADIEVSVVLPCLNEEDTVGICIKKAKDVFDRLNISGEVIVVDNGSTDGTAKEALAAGAKVVYEDRKGYGYALRRGINEAQGKYVVICDGDDTYDLSELHKFIEALREGNDLVIGSRFKGKILKNAMAWTNRYIGNPLLTGMIKLFFRANLSDTQSGYRGFSKEVYKKMNLKTTGMEFASEMVVHALKKKMKIKEVPITYYPRKGESKLSKFRDAWRHIRFILLYSPNYLFNLPGLVIFLAGALLTLRLLFGPIYFLGRAWDVHVMVFSGMLTILGWQILNIGLAAKVFTNSIGLENSKAVRKMLSFLSLERGIMLGVFIVLIGIVLTCYIFYIWVKNNFGYLAQVKTAIVALVAIVIGVQTIFSFFLFSVLQIKYHSEEVGTDEI
jgi:glycosyltransferase involved in cell wall biosynthesis